MTSPHGYTVWARPALQKQVLRIRHDGQAEVTLRCPALETPYQAIHLEELLNQQPGISVAEASTVKRHVSIRYQPALINLPALLVLCASQRLPAEPVARQDLDAGYQRASDDALKRLLVAGIFGMQAMMFAIVLYFTADDAAQRITTELFRWLGFIATTPVVAYAAVPFFRHAWQDCKSRRLGIDVPIALAIVLIYLASAWSTFRGSGQIWFDSVSMLVFVLLAGRFLELRIRIHQAETNRSLSAARPLTATRQLADGRQVLVPLAELESGHIVHVAEGGMVPVDGRLESASAHFDNSLHSGESEVLVCQRGASVTAGSIALDGPASIRATSSGLDNSLSRLDDLIERAQRRHANTQPRQDRAVPWFIGGILGTAAFTALLWLVLDPARAFDAAVSVLVVACPCAFALAAPATLTRTVTLLARHGVRVAKPAVIGDLPRITDALFDKTGTLTRPTASLRAVTLHADIEPARAQTLAVSLARESTHPLARSLLEADRRDGQNRGLHPVTAVRVVAGRGIYGQIQGDTYMLGRPPAGQVDGRDAGQALWLSRADGTVLASFPVKQQLGEDALVTVDRLRQMHVALGIISGDAPGPVADTAAQLRIDNWQARQLPADKHRRIERLRQQGRRVLAVGDGSNDTAALAAANISIALSQATDQALRQADIVVTHLHQILDTRAMAMVARRIFLQNRGWGLAWNTLALPFAVAGLIPPWVAAIGMSTSSLLVLLNVMRMQYVPDISSAARA